MSNFNFLTNEWPDIQDAADRAEASTTTDPAHVVLLCAPRYRANRQLDLQG